MKLNYSLWFVCMKKLKELEIENNEMRDKTSNTDGNVSLFIKEMNELLD